MGKKTRNKKNTEPPNKDIKNNEAICYLSMNFNPNIQKVLITEFTVFTRF